MQSNHHHPLNCVGRCSVSSGNGSGMGRSIRSCLTSRLTILWTAEPTKHRSHPVIQLGLEARCAVYCWPQQGRPPKARSEIGEAGRNLLFLQSWEGTQEQGQQLSSPQKKSLHLKCRLYATMSSSVIRIGKYMVETTFSVETWKSIKEPYLQVFRKSYSTSGGLSI